MKQINFQTLVLIRQATFDPHLQTQITCFKYTPMSSPRYSPISSVVTHRCSAATLDTRFGCPQIS